MKADEKKLIYDILKTADAHYCGYVRDIFKNRPIFKDDVFLNSENSSPSQEISSAKVDENQETLRANQKAEKPVAENSETAISLERLNEKIARCTRCQLARTRNNVVPGMGVKNPLVLVVGEGPGRDEDLQGLPFVGKAGILLDKMLNAIDLDRNKNCYIANVVKCRPPENRNPLFQESDACFPFLQTQIHILKPKMILCMGKISTEKLLNQSVSITQSHGKFFEYNGVPLMPTYHPSALLRNVDLKRPAWEDLKKFKKKLEEIADI